MPVAKTETFLQEKVDELERKLEQIRDIVESRKTTTPPAQKSLHDIMHQRIVETKQAQPTIPARTARTAPTAPTAPAAQKKPLVNFAEQAVEKARSMQKSRTQRSGNVVHSNAQANTQPQSRPKSLAEQAVERARAREKTRQDKILQMENKREIRKPKSQKNPVGWNIKMLDRWKQIQEANGNSESNSSDSSDSDSGENPVFSKSRMARPLMF